MAPQLDSTTLTLNRRIEFDRTTRDYAMYLDDELVGYARTYHEGEVTLDNLVAEILTSQPTRHYPVTLPLPPLDAVAETLDELDHVSGNMSAFRDARARLDAGIPIVADGPAFWLDAVLVTPDPAHYGWPWQCACEEVRCWHAALAEAFVITCERQAELVTGLLPFEE